MKRIKKMNRDKEDGKDKKILGFYPLHPLHPCLISTGFRYDPESRRAPAGGGAARRPGSVDVLRQRHAEEEIGLG